MGLFATLQVQHAILERDIKYIVVFCSLFMVSDVKLDLANKPQKLGKTSRVDKNSYCYA